MLIKERPPMKKYIVKLTEEERGELHQLIAHGQAPARSLAHAAPTSQPASTQTGWSTGSVSDRADLQPARGGTGTLDAALAGRQAGASAHRGEHQPGNRAAGVTTQRTQTLAQRAVVYPAQEQCRVCLPDGRGAGRVHSTLR